MIVRDALNPALDKEMSAAPKVFLMDEETLQNSTKTRRTNRKPEIAIITYPLKEIAIMTYPLRQEPLNIHTTPRKGKVIGTIISIRGVMMMSFYKGGPIIWNAGEISHNLKGTLNKGKATTSIPLSTDQHYLDKSH